MSQGVQYGRCPEPAARPKGQMQSDRIQRNLLPLQAADVEGKPSATLSRGVKQRVGQRRFFQKEAQRTVMALNSMYTGQGVGSRIQPVNQLRSAGQKKVLEFIDRAVAQTGRPPDLSGPEALEALRVSEGYEVSPTTSPLGSYVLEKVALPSSGLDPVPLSQLWGPDGQFQVEEFLRLRLVGTDEGARRLEHSGVKRCYQDPAFNSEEVYSDFVRRLLELNLVEVRREKPVEKVGLFFVKKKQDKLRLIMDCRRSNCHFEDPLPVSLATGESLSRVESMADQPLYMASADLQNAFYTLEMPGELRKFFGLKAVRAGKLGVEELHGRAIGPNEWLHPVVKVVPMGWSWALWWCQSVHEKIAERAGLTEAERLRDRHPVTSDRFWHIQYVDNLHVLGVDEEEVKTRFWQTVGALKESGLTVHEIEEGQTEGSSVKMLGWEIHGSGRVAPSRERLWKVRLAVREMLRRGTASGQQLERLLGHMTFISLCRREALSVLGESYTFIRRHYQQVVQLWKSVRIELQKWDGIAPLVFSDLRRPWSNQLLAVDASEWGLGVTSSMMGSEDNQRLGRVSERWRFKDAEARNPRQFVFAEDEQKMIGQLVVEDEAMYPLSSGDPISIKDVPSTPSFETVGFEVVDRNWQVVGRYRWQRKESMPVYEARASLHAIQHHLRSLENYEKKHVILTDSMTAAVAFDKGRAQGFKLRRVVQQTSALAMASCCLFRMRWIPSEWNPADGPSRGRWMPTVPSRFGCNDTSTTWGDCDMAQQESQAEPPSCPTIAGQKRRSSPYMGHRVGSGEEARSEEEGTPSAETEERLSGQPCDVEASVSHGGHQEEIPDALEKLRAVGKEQSEAAHEPGLCGDCESYCADGQIGGRLSGVPLHEWRGPQCGELHNGSYSLQHTVAEEPGCLTRGIAVYERVAKIMSSQEQDAAPIRSGVFGGAGSSSEERGGGRAHFTLELFPLLEANGGLPSQSQGHCEASERRRIELWPLLFPAAPNGTRRSVKNYAVGRSVGVGPQPPEVSGACTEQVAEAGSEKQRQPGLFSQSRKGEQVHVECVGAPGPSKSRASTHVPSSTRRSFSRCDNAVSQSAGHTKPGQMAGFEECPQLREGLTTSTVVREPGRKRATKSSRGRKVRQQALLGPALTTRMVLHFAVFLEIFSGSGRLGRAVHRACNWTVLLWDIEYGDNYDLTQRRNQQLILHWMQSGQIRGGHLGTPCNSFSRARDRPGGPPRLRSDQLPLGLPDLRPCDARKVQIGNCLMRFTCRVLLMALQLFLPFSLENPHRSRLWLCPGIKAVSRRRRVEQVEVTFCSFGTLWKKPTRFLAVNLSLDLLLGHFCKSSKRGQCQYTGECHVPLMGTNKDGIWLTKVAEPYPIRLTSLLAKCFKNTELAAIAATFARHV